VHRLESTDSSGIEARRAASSEPRPSGAVKNSKIASFFGRKLLKTNDRDFAKTVFLTAPQAREGDMLA
jgi:hypothetical protein